MKLWLFLLLIGGSVRVLGQDEEIAAGEMNKEGVDVSIVSRLEGQVTNGVYPNIHSLLIARHGKLVYEHYWTGKDETLGEQIDDIDHGGAQNLADAYLFYPLRRHERGQTV